MKEFEAKFYVRDLDAVRERIHAVGGKTAVERHLERNWRYDLPDRSLSESGAVLRLRDGPDNRLTFKRPIGAFEERREIELRIDDLPAAQALLEELGYQVVALYEKYRETLTDGEHRLMLDELPFGQFIEIEAPSLEEVESASARLGLLWELRVPHSYLDLYQRIRAKLELPSQEATFSAFRDFPAIDPEQLELKDAFAPTELEP